MKRGCCSEAVDFERALHQGFGLGVVADWSSTIGFTLLYVFASLFVFAPPQLLFKARWTGVLEAAEPIVAAAEVKFVSPAGWSFGGGILIIKFSTFLLRAGMGVSSSAFGFRLCTGAVSANFAEACFLKRSFTAFIDIELFF